MRVSTTFLLNSEEPPEEATEEPPEEAAEKPPEETSEEPAEEAAKEPPEEAAEEAPEERPKEPAEETSPQPDEAVVEEHVVRETEVRVVPVVPVRQLLQDAYPPVLRRPTRPPEEEFPH